MAGLVADVAPERLGEAIVECHGLLDRALSDGAPLEEVRRFRIGLLRLARGAAEAEIADGGSSYRRLLLDVSHDIRSPLNSILFLADGLLGEQSGSLNEVQRRQLGVVYSAASALLNLVNDLLDFARLHEEAPEEPSSVSFSVQSVLSDVRHLVDPVADHHGTRLTIQVDAEDPRSGDPHVLRRVLLNLVSNALKATWEVGEVRVLVRDEDEGRTLRVDVDDDGEGVDVDMARELIRGSSGSQALRMLEGQTHGLGLIICGRKVRSVEGDLDVRRRESGGTRFTVRLPFARESERA